MKRIIALLITIVCILNMSVVVFSEDETEETATYTTGSLEMSPEAVAQLKANIPMITGVKPNQLYIDRLNEEPEISLMSNGLNYEIAEDGEEIITNTDDSIHLMGTDNIPLPSKVDNSTENTFPIIKNQGGLNSCLGWSLGYYQLTNNANKIRGTKAKNGNLNNITKVYSPNWIYNLGNWGDNRGMSGNRALNVLYTYGCPTLYNVPVETSATTPSNYLSWYPVYDIWDEALYNKCDVYYGTVNPDNTDTPITSPNSPYLDDIKKILSDGYVVTIETYVGDNNPEFPIVKSGRTSNNTSKNVWIEIQNNDDTTGHAVTIVGYDDNFKVDINGNGSYENGEYGAFKIANSWGIDADYHDDGYIWLAYDSLNFKSSVKATNNVNRVAAFRNGNVYYFVKPQKEYKPLLTAEVTFKTSRRCGITVYLGIEDVSNTNIKYEKIITMNSVFNYNDDDDITTIAFNNGYGEYNLSGNNSSDDDTGSVVFDFTPLLENFELKYNHNYNLYMKITDSTIDSDTKIRKMKIKDHYNNTTYSSADVPISFEGNHIATVGVGYMSSIRAVNKNKTFLLNFNSKLNKDTINTSNISVSDNEENVIDIVLDIDSAEKSLYLTNKNGSYTNGFYTLTVSPQLKSKGGNSLTTPFSYPFYVPFH